MEKKRKLNKFKVGIVIIIIIAVVFSLSVFGRYLYNTAREAYFTARQFYFSSNILLAGTGAHYTYTNWDGEAAFPIEFELYSYLNEISKLDYDLEYTVTCTTNDTDKVRCTVNSIAESATNTATGTIFATTNTSKAIVYVTPITDIEEDESVTVIITASTTEPYQKTISGEFIIVAENQGTTSYSIKDVTNRDYAIFEITNISNAPIQYTIEFDPRELRIDMNDEIYVNRKQEVTTTIGGKSYVKKIVFDLSAETTRRVKFYKVDKSQNYTYPGVDDVSAIQVSL